MKDSFSRSRFKYLAPAVAAAILALPALAQAPRTNNPAAPVPRSTQDPVVRAESGDLGKRDEANRAGTWSLQGDTLRASKIIGASVEGSDGVEAGNINDLAIDLETGRVLLVIVGHGGIAGIGTDYTALPPAELLPTADEDDFKIKKTAKELRDAPKFDLSKWSESTDAAKISETYRLFGHQMRLDNRRTTRALPDGTQAEPRTARPAASPAQPGADAAAAFLGTPERASKIMGANVQNLADDKIGTVDDLIVDLAGGRLLTAVISSGGFLGIGDEKSVVPAQALQWDANSEAVHMDVTRERLLAAPRFQGDDWPKQDESYVNRAYRALGFDSRLDERDADNTALNVRDREGQTLTPLDQGNSPLDLDITSRIRKALVAQEGLSINARNIKVITVEGRVTLRGTVNSAEEKSQVGKLANDVVGLGKADNQLEVK